MTCLSAHLTRRTWLGAALAGSLGCPARTGWATPSLARSLTLGTQPLGVPCGAIGALMGRDRVLHHALASSQWSVTSRPFSKGSDMLPLFPLRQLTAGFLGDMPTLVTASLGETVIVEASSAHYTLLRGLHLAGMGETHITLVPLAIDQMVNALDRGDIDAFAGWEPASSLALMRHRANRVIFRGSTTDYLVLSHSFAQDHPEVCRILIAGFVRAIQWMRRSRLNLDKAVRWANEDATSFSGRSLELPLRQLVAIVQRDLLEVPSAPLVSWQDVLPPLQQEFEFLAGLGKLPSQARWAHVEQAFGYDGLPTVLTQAQRYQTDTFNYRE